MLRREVEMKMLRVTSLETVPIHLRDSIVFLSVQLQNGAEGTTETEEPVRMDIGEPKLDSADTEPDPNINIQVGGEVTYR